MEGFIYGQTEYNILNNALKLKDYVNRASEFGYTSLTITDPNLHGFYKFYKLCTEKNIKPIIGLEVKIIGEKNTTYLCYAKNRTGFSNLIKLSSLIAYKENITLDVLHKHSNGLIIVLSCFSLSIIDASSEEDIIDVVNKGKIFDDYYVGISFQAYRLRENLKEFASTVTKLNISMLPLHRTFYLEQYDKEVFLELKLVSGVETSLHRDDNFSVIDKDSLKSLFSGYTKLFSTYREFEKKVNLDLNKNKVTLPEYPSTNNLSSKTFLRNLVAKGITRRLSRSKANKNLYYERIKHELSIIDKMGYNDYFLIVYDFVRFAKKEGIMVGPGRGSAAGSLVSYCLGITNIDPLKYGLLFERFLNPERISMPDIDMDFPDDKRDFVIEYVRKKYGKEHVCNISAFGTFQLKSSIRDLCRVHNIKPDRATEIVKMAVAAKSYNELIGQFTDDKTIYNILRIAKKFENLPHHISTHAAGIILSNEKLSEIVPIQPGINNMTQAQLEAVDLEELGLLKIDFLGIRNLTIIDNICKEINGLDNISISSIPLDDKETYRMFQSGDTLGIFQLESPGITKVITNLKPTKFTDIIAVLALYRPGPMDNIPTFISRKFGEKFSYLHKDLEGILSETYGVIVYQEQIMQIALQFAGYNLGEADLLRRAVSKKKEEVLVAEREKFVKRSVSRGYEKTTANEIYDYIVKFANYGFNKSHSTAYALVAYQMAYLKTNYFHIFMSNLLNNVIGSASTLKRYIAYCKMHGLNTVSPDVNLSDYKFVTTKEGLVMPFTTIKGIGSSVSNEIIKERKNGEYTSFSDFKNRVSKASDSVLMALIYSGAFDRFGITKKSLIDTVTTDTNFFDKYIDDPIMKYDIEYDEYELKKKEEKYLGFNLKYNIFRDSDVFIERYRTSYFRQCRLNKYAKIVGEILDIRKIYTKKDDEMCFLKISDNDMEFDAVVFPKSYAEFFMNIQMNKLLLFDGRVTENDRTSKLQYVVSSISVLSK